ATCKQPASNALATCKRVARPETETETETETEHTCAAEAAGASKVNDFSRFWKAYPRKRGKESARKAWSATKRKRPPIDKILSAIDAQTATKQWQRDGGQYVPYPATWLKAGGWDDEVEQPALYGYERQAGKVDYDALILGAGQGHEA
ncbi:MAG: hypothetical protein GY844_26165, partial [Bradyrhizobium sp.]|nr:hypothetical protein [Bradyrhizobium sp.]